MKKIYHLFLQIFLASMIVITPAMVFGQEEEGEQEKEKMTRKEKKANFDRYGYIGINGGLSLGHSDLSENKWLPPQETWTAGGSLFGGWQFHPIWGLKAQIANQYVIGYKTGDPKLTNQSGFNTVRYENNVIDYSAQLRINLSNLISGYNDRLVDFYTTIGAGWAEWQTESFDTETGTLWRKNGIDGAENDIPVILGDDYGSGASWFGERTRTTYVPVALGVDFHIAPKWDILVESQWKWVDSDRFDTYVDGAMAVKGDMYSLTSLGVQYRFGGGDPLKKMEKEFPEVTFVTTPDPLEAHGGMVKVKIVGTFPEKYFHPKAAMEFTPMLVHEDGTYELKSVMLKGQDVAGEGILIPQSGGTFTYEDEFPYQEGFRASELQVSPVIFLPKEPLTEDMSDEQIEGYKYRNLPQSKLADGVIITPMKISHNEIPLLAYHGYEKETILSKMAKIYFYVNRHDLNWRVPLNRADESKQKLDELFDFLSLGYEIKDINIDGWASPEGEESFNEGLSERRANTAHTYMKGKINKLVNEEDSKMNIEDADDVNFNIASFGPDWNGFLKLVKESDIQDKNMILNVINSADSPAKKEQEIRNMIIIYPELEEDILPPLRRAEITVNCYEPKKTDDEIATLGLTNPRELDEKELLYSATLSDDNAEKLKIYKAMINNYPNNYKGYVNAASIEIEMGEMDAAKEHLEKAKQLEPNSGEVHNNLGVIYAMEGDYGKAEENFKKAQELGEDVDYNMGIIMITKGEYTKAENLFGSKDCDFNVGLVEMLNEKYEDAKQTLECAPKDAHTYYLMGVLGARMENKSMMLENLTEAVKADENLKSEIAKDREFIEYFDDPDFKALVQ